jgi:hypothetical protein
MQQLIAAYLFQHKNCPLPGLGTLWVKPGNAQTDFSNKAINAPTPAIEFDTKETDAGKLLDYIAIKNNSTIYQAIETLGQFGNNLKSTILSKSSASLDGVGSFSADASGNISFTATPLPAAFLQPVTAERVIHPQAEHQILVGDKETTNTVMTEYFSEDIPVQKNRWWIWALVLGAIGMITLLVYMNSAGFSPRFGNAVSIKYL